MKRNANGALSALIVSIALGLFSAWASAAKPGWNYVVNPPYLKGPAINTTASPNWPGVGNHCELIFGTPYPLACYDPTQVRNAYNVPSELSGAGQTIIIVDAYGDPDIRANLATFDAFFGLPDPPSFTIYSGSATQKAGPHGASSWALETALDVEWAHAIAPGAAIVLIEAPSSSGNAINSVERKIISRYPGAVVSQSFGIPEFAVIANNAQIMQAHQNYKSFAQQGTTVLASSGDFGATNGASFNNAAFPSSDPYVVSVGGTQGNPYPYGLCPGYSDDCSYSGESTWNEPDYGIATGGGPSKLFGAPSYQIGLTGQQTRATPDVAYNAAVNGGVLVVKLPYFYLVGGTSAGSPQWAGIFALANQARANVGKGPVGAANPRLYSIYTGADYVSDFHDVTTGDNTLAGAPVAGFAAGSGYDMATGLGSPNAANLISTLVAQP